MFRKMMSWLVLALFVASMTLQVAGAAEKKEDYHKASRLSKLIMLFGLLYTILFKFLII